MTTIPATNTSTSEFETRPVSGWSAVPLLIGAGLVLVFLFVLAINRLDARPSVAGQWFWGILLALTVLGGVIDVVCIRGLFAVAPGSSMVLLLFGEYKGTVRATGFHWVNPLNQKVRLSLRVRNMTTEKLKVNDIRGNPVE